MKLRFALSLVATLWLTAPLAAVAPGSPQNLQVSVTGNTVTLTWSAPATGGVPTGYIVSAALSPGGAAIATLPVTDTMLIVQSVPNAVYYVHVRGVNIDGTGAASNEVVVSVPSGGSSCTTPPNAPTNFNAVVSGSLVTLSWAAPLSGCGATAYSVQAGSAPGLSNLAILNVGSATSLSVSAPVGTYYVRVVALNAFGGSVSSVEIVVRVGQLASGQVTITFDGLTGVVNRSPVTTYNESGFTLTATAQSWEALTTFGNPAPFIQFTRPASQTPQVGEVTVNSSGAVFMFESIDLYSSVTTIPYEFIGLRNGVALFAFSGTVPNTFGAFVTVSNTQPTLAIDTLLIRLTNPPTTCCSNPVGLDNLVVSRP